MSRPEPEYAVGGAVMIRSKDYPSRNCNYALVVEVKLCMYQDSPTGEDHIGWGYKTNMDKDQHYWHEEALRPIPREKPNGIDALEFIKDLAGVSA